MLRNIKARAMARKHKPRAQTQTLQLSIELLHIIVIRVVVDYLDDLIVLGPLISTDPMTFATVWLSMLSQSSSVMFANDFGSGSSSIFWDLSYMRNIM